MKGWVIFIFFVVSFGFINHPVERSKVNVVLDPDIILHFEDIILDNDAKVLQNVLEDNLLLLDDMYEKWDRFPRVFRSYVRPFIVSENAKDTPLITSIESRICDIATRKDIGTRPLDDLRREWNRVIDIFNRMKRLKKEEPTPETVTLDYTHDMDLEWDLNTARRMKRLKKEEFISSNTIPCTISGDACGNIQTGPGIEIEKIDDGPK